MHSILYIYIFPDTIYNKLLLMYKNRNIHNMEPVNHVTKSVRYHDWIVLSSCIRRQNSLSSLMIAALNVYFGSVQIGALSYLHRLGENAFCSCETTI